MANDIVEPDIGKEKIVDIWLHHNDKIWRSFFTTPVLAGTFLVGWYSLRNSTYLFLSNSILIGGMIAMFLQFLILRRMIEFAIAMYMDILPSLPKPAKPLLGLSAFTIVKVIPLVLAALFGILLIAPTT